MTNLYTKGQKVRCSVNFTVSGTLTDPTTVTFKYKKPGLTTVTTLVYGTDAALVKDAVGQYHADIITDKNGEWQFRFEGTGTCTAVEEQPFKVASVF